MLQWIEAFLTERRLRVKINGEVSASYTAENGTVTRW